MRPSLFSWVFSLVLALAAAVPAWAVPTISNLTTPVLPANAARTPINSLRVSSGSTTPTRYNITSVPSGGTLYVNGTAVTAARSLTPTEATQLSFLPSGTAGNYSFTFTASDGTKTADTSPAVTYALTVGQASCGQAAGLDFSTRTTNENWKSQSATVGNVTISTSGYSASAGSVADRFDIENVQNGMQSASLTWYTDYSASNASTSQVTFTFSRALTGFTIVVQDIDATSSDLTTAGFIDQVQFDGYTSGAATPIALSAANIKLGSTNAFSGNNRVTGNNSSAADPADNVTVTFPQAITKLTLTYRNVQTSVADPSVQAVGIPSFGWCAEADIATTLTGPTRAQAGSTVTYSVTTTNNGPDVPTTVTPTLQLPTGLAGVTPSSGTYNTSTGLVTFAASANLAVNAAVSNSVSFTMPASNAVSGTATYSSAILDNTSTNNTVTLSTAQNRAPVANDVTNSPAILRTVTTRTNIAPFSASDPDGNTTIASYTILSLPTAAMGTLYVDGVAATVNQVINLATNPGYQLSFVSNSTATTNATFTYKAIDDVNVSSNTATYTVPVTAGADLVSVATGQSVGVEGQSKSYSVTTTNNGPAASTNVVPTLTLSGKPAFSNVTVSNGSYDPTTGIVTFNPIASLASGASVVSTIVLVVPSSPASFTVKAANTSDIADPTPANNNGTAAAAILTVAVSPIGPAGAASACATPGRDGSATLNATSTPNTYYPATNQTVAAGANSLIVGTAVGATPIAAGDLLLVMQMQGADIDYSNTDAYGDGVAGGLATGNLTNANFRAGQYEYVVAGGPVALSGGTLTLLTNTTFKNSYQNADATSTTGQRRFQVVRIPQYVNLTVSGTVSPTAWNGSTGGILVLDVTGQLTFAAGAKLDASGLGFRGGAGQKLTGTTGLTGTDYRAIAPTSGTTTTGAHAMKGEGIVGTPRYVNTGTALLDTGTDGYPSGSAGRGAPGNGGGGGTDASPTDNSQNSGGGGGGNGARGGRGGNSWSLNTAVGGESGSPFSSPSTSRLILGGGGGAGSSNDGTGGGPSAGYASSGAAGGGIVLVRTGSVRGAGTVLSNGASASNAVLTDGSGGGGAGGAILITANNTASLSSLTLAANGGNGGTNTGGGQAHGPGGGGAGGIVLTNAAPGSASVVSGTNGTTAGGVAYGATAGVTGITNSQISNSIAGSAAGITCSTDVVATISGPSTAASGQTVSLSVVFANNGGADASTVTRKVVLSSGSAATNDLIVNVVANGGIIGSPDPTTGDITITYPSVSPLAAGSSAPFGISYTAPGTTAVTATASITTTSTEPVTDNNTSMVSTAITGFADVVTAVYGLASSTTGRPTATYAVGFANNGPAAASNVTRKVTLPAGATLTTDQLKVITDQGGTYANGIIDFGTVTTLNSRESKVFQFSYTASNTGGSDNIVSNIGTSSAQDASNGTGQAPDQSVFAVTNNATSDLATNGVTVSTSAVVPGQQASFTLNFINYGPADAASALRYAQLTPGLNGVSVTNGGSYDKTTGIITYPAIAIANGASAPSVVTFTAPPTGPVNISGSLSGGGGSASSGIFGNNQATASIAVTPVADVATTLNGPTSAVTGNLVTFAVTTTNAGVSPAAAVGQTVTLPKNLTNVFASSNGTYDASTGVVTFPTLPLLAPGTSFNNTVSFPMPGTQFTASAAVTTTTQEAAGTSANNAATAPATTPAAATTDQANVYTTLSSANQVLAPGASLTFTVVTGNNGPKPASNVVQQLALSPGLTMTSNTGTYDPITGIVTFPTITSQVSGASVTNTVAFAAPLAGPVVAVASVTSATSDPVPADNVAVLSVDIFNRTDVATTLIGPGVASSTQVPTFTVLTSNRGLIPAVNVVQMVTIGAGFLPADVTVNNGGVYNSTTGIITWPAVASLAPGEIKTYGYSYLAPAMPSTDVNNPRTIVSRATVTSNTFDTNGANNSVAVATEIKWNSDISVGVAGPTTAVLGNPVTFTVATINNGPAPAANVSTSVRILTGLTGVVASGGGVYDSSTGIVTFPTIASQLAGVTGAVTNTITLIVPDRPIIGVSAAANNMSNDINLTNNAANLIIPVTPRTSTLVDLQTDITSNLSSQLAGQPIILTVTATNAGGVAAGMRQRVALPAALTGVVVSSGSYDAATGTVTFPFVSNQPAGTSLTYTITVNNPGNDPLVATASLNSTSFSDPTPANNTKTVSVTIVPVADVATILSGPATMLPGVAATYQVVTVNNGPSPANAVVQKVQLPTGLTGVEISGGGTYDTGSGVVTFPTIATEAVGQFGEITNTISFLFPVTATTVVSTVTSNTSENGVTANNTSSLTTNQTNRTPLATTVINRLQTPEGNTAAPLALSALAGYDSDGSVASFTIGTLPATAAGVLRLNGTAVQVGDIISIGNASNLTFDPAATFVGNAFFTYSATDNLGVTSVAAALYTIPVGQDNTSAYTATTPKGGTVSYQDGDIIASVFDANGGTYNASAAVVDNGVRTALATVNTLPPGVQLDPATGQLTVYDRTLLVSGAYSARITTVDANGGVTSQDVPLQIGANPLPVELTRFDAKAVGLDANLSWTTAQERSNQGFAVERSFDGQTFEPLTFVAGAGSSTQPLTYSFIDGGVGQQHPGTVYYRLQQRDLTGKTTYSPVRTVAFAPQQLATADVTLYPNPAAEQTTLDLTALPTGPYQVVVVDMSGRLVQARTLAGGTAHTLLVSGLPTGAYLVLISNDKLKLTKRLIKQ
ncbi:MAG: T9SS type A sorting domain-containing protein [Janthinobacterium lividum]